jgi:hypothetical protein
MRNTSLMRNRTSGRPSMSAANTAQGSSTPSPVGGWDAISPIAAMPPQNATALVNWFPQPGYVELRRGFIEHADTATGLPVETVMGYQSSDASLNALFAASDGEIFDVTTSTVASVGSGFTSNRWQHTNFITSGGSFLWMCNGEDTPQYWDGAALAPLVITGVTPEDMVYVTPYRSRLWTVLKNSTEAAYLAVDSIQGAATTFDVGANFRNGGYLQAIGTWSTDTNDGPNEFIAFVSQFGDVAVYQIEDPDDATKVFFRGTASLSTPIGRRCLCKIGSDLGIITIDGVLPLSQVLSYDKAALLGASVTKNIRQAMTDAAQNFSTLFGWQLVSYPRNTMAILNVPLAENTTQDQFVMNTITGAWGRFQGQNGSCWEVFEDRAYFGGNDGIVRLADEAGGDENQTLEADMRCAFNYYGQRGREKRWTMIRPSITIDATFPVQPFIGLNVDFGENAELAPVEFDSGAAVALWDSAIWDEAQWPGVSTQANWFSIGGLGYCASVRMTVSIPWSADLLSARSLKVNGFDMLYDYGSFI